MEEKRAESLSMSARVSELARLLRSGGQTDEQLAAVLHDAHECDIAAALELLDIRQRARLYRLLGVERLGDVFAYVSDAGKYLRELPQEQAADIVEAMDADDAVDALETVSPELRSALMEKLDPESQHDIRLICSYQPDEIGSAMSTNFVSINRHLSVKQAMRALIAQAEENDNISTLFVNDDDGSFYGAIALKDLIVAREETALDSLISRHFPAVLAHEQIEACLDRLRSYAEASIPVLGEKRRVIGVITTDDIVEAVDDAMGDDYAKLGGLTGEEDLHEPLKTSLKKRLPWLIILLFLGMGVSSVVGLFESVVSQVALIVCFQSLILDMAGNVGTQSLAVTIRVLMDERLTGRQKLGLVFKEMRVGFFSGLLLGLLALVFIGLYVWLLKGKTLFYALCISGCAGAFNFYDTVTDGNQINTALDIIAEGGFDYVQFDRAGYGMLNFQCDFGPTQFEAVRHAVALLLDRNEFANTFCQGWGGVVNGMYGTGLWQYQEAEEWLEMTLNPYSYDPEAAVEELKADGWVYNADGSDYVDGSGEIRYKKVTEVEAGTYAHNVTLADGTILMPLIIEWSSSENNPVSELLNVMLAQGTQTAEAGMKINQNVMTFTELLNYYYRDASQGDKYAVPTYGMLNLASNFTPAYDQSYEWTLDPDMVAQGYNLNRLYNEAMDALTMNMVYGVDSSNTQLYMTYWKGFQMLWNELLPQIPLYSNIYITVYPDWLENYTQDSFWEFQQAILYATVAE